MSASLGSGGPHFVGIFCVALPEEIAGAVMQNYSRTQRATRSLARKASFTVRNESLAPDPGSSALQWVVRFGEGRTFYAADEEPFAAEMPRRPQ